MDFAKLIIEHLKNGGDSEAAKELEGICKEFEDAMSSEDTSAEDIEMLKVAMSFFDEEAYNELLNHKKEDEEAEDKKNKSE